MVWQPELCEHSAKCFHNLPSVFDPRARPWVRTDAATEDEIKQAIDLCPSGALRYEHNEEIAADDSETPDVKVEVIKGGPLRVHGPFVVQHSDGRTEVKERASLCRCGASKNKPFCDGTHKSIGWDSN